MTMRRLRGFIKNIFVIINKGFRRLSAALFRKFRVNSNKLKYLEGLGRSKRDE